MTMSALGKTGEASGAEMTVPVGGYDVVKSVLWFWLYTSLVVTIKASDGTEDDTCRSYNSLGKSIAGVAPFLSTIVHRRASQCNGLALSPPPPLLIYFDQVNETTRADNH
jgi:hypothetical protein